MDMKSPSKRLSMLDQLYCNVDGLEKQILGYDMTEGAVFPGFTPDDKAASLKMHMRAAYETRALAYRYIREGFEAGCAGFSVQGYLKDVQPNDLLVLLSDEIEHKRHYTGSELIRCLQFYQDIDDDTQILVKRYIEELNPIQARNLVTKWTGSSMVK